MELPDKLYYSISEVAEHIGIEPHVLRYWESEFPTLRPKRSRSGTRTYQKKDIDEIIAIRTLLHEQGYKIEGARKMRRKQIAEAKTSPDEVVTETEESNIQNRESIRDQLADILELVQELKIDERKL